MTSRLPRTFQKLDIAFNSHTYHPFLLERFAYAQWNNTVPFVSGPNIMKMKSLKADSYNYWGIAGKIDHGMRYFMKDHATIVYGYNIGVPHSTLLVRTWLNATEKQNRVLILMENVDGESEYELYRYMVAVNSSSSYSWHSNIWARFPDKLQQTILRTDDNYGTRRIEMK